MKAPDMALRYRKFKHTWGTYYAFDTVMGAGIRPTLFIHQRCGRLIETLPTLQHDPNRPENVLKIDMDEDGIGGDDCADSLRYLEATKSRTVSRLTKN